MASTIVSTYSEGCRVASVYAKELGGYRVIMIDSYFETQEESHFDFLSEAENHAEDWVLLC
jgi:hypothetical protein